MTYLALPRPAPCIGIDLAGLPHRETGIAILRAGQLDLLTTAHTDDDIMALVATVGAHGTVAVNAPLSLPEGRCCLEDDCPCRHDPGTRSRAIERELLHQRVPILATGLINVLARRGIRLADILRRAGWEPLEVYPYATLRLLGLPTAGKRTQLGRRRIHSALQPVIPGLDHPDATEHQLDAVACALTAHLWRLGLTREVGDPAEGLMVIPLATAAEAITPARAALHRVAEPGAGYSTE